MKAHFGVLEKQGQARTDECTAFLREHQVGHLFAMSNSRRSVSGWRTAEAEAGTSADTHTRACKPPNKTPAKVCC